MACGLAAWVVDLLGPFLRESHNKIVELFDLAVLGPDAVVQRLNFFELRSAGFTGRGQGLLLTKSLRENLTLALIRRFSERGLLSRSREAALVREMVDFLRIKAGTPEQLAGTLSGGNQQKVIFGKMLLTEARVLLLYDPTRGVDVGTKGEIFQLMRDLAAQGYAILFYSSDLPELVHVADRVLVLRSGRVAAVLEGARISEEAILRAAVLDDAA